MESDPCYGRWNTAFDAGDGIDSVVFRAPDGSECVRPAYAHQPARLVYDRHGYESVEAAGPVVTAVRFTPTQPGAYSWRAMAGGKPVRQGAFQCEPSDHPGYVRVSDRDGRYFAYTDGEAYCPIGVNLCWPVYYPLPRGRQEFATSDERSTMGVKDYERWLAAMAAGGGNFTRLWLSSPALDVETERAGELDLARFARLDAIVELARRHGVRLKMCLEHWRHLESGSAYHDSRASHPAFRKRLLRPDGTPGPASVDEWFTSPEWRALWLRKVDAYLARYGDDPVVMAWELWNEINCVATSGFAVQREWSRHMLAEIKRRSPRNLVTNSLGSLDHESHLSEQAAFHMDEMDFQQVHRYLDQGARWDICHTDPVGLSVDAVRRARRPDRPVLLAETGAVNDRHTGEFRYCRIDRRGLLLHDVTFAPLFAGAAGSGHSWFWEHYIDPHDLWRCLKPLRQLMDGVRLDREGFQPFDLSTDAAWLLGLAGRTRILLWVRSKADRWDLVYRDGVAPPTITGLTVSLSGLRNTPATAEIVPCWPEDIVAPTVLPVESGIVELPPFRYGMLARLA